MISSLKLSIELSLVALAEGHCPFCMSRLRPHTPAEAAAAATWANPPIGYCAHCDGDVGRYVDSHGTFVGYRNRGPIRPNRHGGDP